MDQSPDIFRKSVQENVSSSKEMSMEETTAFTLDILKTGTNSSFPADNFNVSDLSKTIDFLSSLNGSNSTTIHDSWEKDMKLAINVIMLYILIIIMLAMGCEITLTNLWKHMKRPISLSIGILSQFVIMPLTAFTVLTASGVQGIQATGVLIISCCPSGALSNTFTYFCDGDVSLSVAMTTLSTIVAMGMLPANMWFYGRHFETVDLVIPYQKMAFSLIFLTLPIAAGLILKWKLPRVAAWTTKFATWTCILLLIACTVIGVSIIPNIFASISLKLYCIMMLLPLLGMCLGYSIASMVRQNVPVCRTIAIECGVQNIPLSLTIIVLSFPLEMQEEMIVLPWIYAFSMLGGSTVLCIIYKLRQRLQKHNFRKESFKLEGDDNDTERGELMNGNVQININLPKEI